ncbi:MAG: nucleotide sugar dehydrogenase [Candidatus Altiarchaeota archaeon]|nr:nucleotide sugar dehydrogenase [Candidatus Altiarchaeota archaeon]
MDKTVKIGVIGLGYVGLPLSIAFANKFKVYGYDVSSERIESLSRGESHIVDIKDEEVKRVLKKTFYPTKDKKDLVSCDFLIICVPTPLDKKKKPDLSYIKDATRMISSILRENHFVILESTTYPGTTEEVVIPLLEKSSLKVGRDFRVAFSPERVDPGNKKYRIENTPKVVGGYDSESTEIAFSLYSTIVEAGVIKVKDCRTAEAIKIFENIFRGVNIALVNEIALIFEKMGIDTWEAINAASTKPFGFMPFYPGPGIGGHCIPLDPYYLSYKARQVGYNPRFIELSGELNDYMKVHAVNLVTRGLKAVGKRLFDSKIAVMGLAYKRDIDDTRESPTEGIIEELVNQGSHVKVYDPFAKSIKTDFGVFKSEKTLSDALSGVDCAIFVTDHTEFKKIDMQKFKETMNSPVVVDCKNIFDRNRMEGFGYYGIGKPLLD